MLNILNYQKVFIAKQQPDIKPPEEIKQNQNSYFGILKSFGGFFTVNNEDTEVKENQPQSEVVQKQIIRDPQNMIKRNLQYNSQESEQPSKINNPDFGNQILRSLGT